MCGTWENHSIGIFARSQNHGKSVSLVTSVISTNDGDVKFLD